MKRTYRDWRTIRSMAFVFLPAVAYAAFACYFFAEGIPVVERDAVARALSECEVAASGLRSRLSSATFVWSRGKGVVSGVPTRRLYPAQMTWKDWNPVSYKRGEAWGWLSAPGGRTVWVRGDGEDYQTAYALETGISPGFAGAALRIALPLSVVMLFALAFFGARRLADNARIRGDFLEAVAHDLANPLVGMRFAIKNDPQTALRLNERMMRIVANIRDFINAGANRPAPRCEPFDLVEAFDEAYGVFAPDYRDIHGRDIVKTVKTPCAMVLGDSTLAVQIFWNIIGNAMKYAAPIAEVRAEFDSDASGNVVARIVDDGPGMTRRDATRVFDRYFRSRSARRSGKSGFGIGLCSAKEFAKSMNGDLTLGRNLPHGCVFTLVLPSAVSSLERKQ